MLLLTTTARERAWRLLKITGPLIGWLDGDSPIHGVSPRLAPLSWCMLYIVAVQRTSEQLFLRLQNSNSQMASTILVNREGVECEKLLALQGQLETAMKTTIRNAFDAFGANLQCCVFFFSFAFGGPVIFFFESHVDQTVNRLGTRVEFTETEDLSKKFAGCRQRNVVTVEVFENVLSALHAHLQAHGSAAGRR